VKQRNCLNHNVKVIAPIPIVPKYLRSKKKLWEEYDKVPYKETLDGIEIFRPKYIKFPNDKLNFIMEKTFILTVLNAVKREYANNKLDLIHCHMSYPDGIISREIKEIYNVPIVISARGSDMNLSIKDKNKRKWMENIYKQADKIIAPSIQLKNKVEKEFGIQAEYIGNGIYPNELINISNHNLESQFNDKFIVLSISKLIPLKRIE